MSESTSPATADAHAIAAIPQRIVEAWAAQDGAAFGDVFTKDGSMILPGVHLSGRDAIVEFMTTAFAGPYHGTRVVGTPRSMRLLGPDVAVVVTRGGVIAPGGTEVDPERAVHATWVVQRSDEGTWSLAAYQNTPAQAPSA